MNVAVRYQSRGGHVKAMAESFAEGAEVEAISVDSPDAAITEPVDLLFIGGALYKFRLDDSMVAFIESIPEGMVRQAVVFGSSATTRRPVYLMQHALKAKGIDINPMALYQRGRPKPYLFEIVPPFARDQIKKMKKQLAEGTYGKESDVPISKLIDAWSEKDEASSEVSDAEAKKRALQAEQEALQTEQAALQEELSELLAKRNDLLAKQEALEAEQAKMEG